MTIRFGPEACGTLEEASKREWLVADGAGGYAMGTIAGLRTPGNRPPTRYPSARAATMI